MKYKHIEEALRSIDCCMMTTISANDEINTRPMLHNKEWSVKEGCIYFFSMKDTQKIRDVMANPHVSLTYQNNENTFFLQLRGKATIEEEAEKMLPYWDKQLNLWWHETVHTKGICMLSIRITWARCWYQGKDQIIES